MSKLDKNQESCEITRRKFLRDAGIVVGGTALGSAALLAACGGETEVTKTVQVPTTVTKTVETKDWMPPKWDKEADVVVIGFGGGGGTAALEAHDAGAKVIILEKMPTPGGSTCLCAGIFYAGGSSVQAAAGINDDADSAYKYVLAVAREKADPALIRIFADKGAETIEWLKSQGATFYSGVDHEGAIPPILPLQEELQQERYGLYYSGGECDPEYAAITPPKPRGHIIKPVEVTWPYPPQHPSAPTSAGITRGTGFFKPLWEGAKSRGIEVLLETRATSLIQNPVTREIVGVKADQKGTTIYVKAKKAVHIATGGYCQNPAMVKMYSWQSLNTQPGSYTSSDTGDGILMGMAAGASVRNMQISLLGTGRPTGAIMVNKGGRRFVDESIYRNGAAEWTGQANNLGYFIFDSKTTSSSDAQADTIAELAEKIGVDPAVLEDTVAFWNESCALGYDREFKAVYNNNHKHDPTDTTVPENRKLRPIDTPPFFAAKRDHARLTANYTMGGLRVNTKAQVLDVYGNVLPRLYAAGVAASTTVGEMYFGSGAAIASSFIFGRIAGKNAAAETVWG